jgi:surface protein
VKFKCEPIKPTPVILKVNNVKTVKINPQDATATPNDVEEGKIFYGKKGREVGTYKKKILTRIVIEPSKEIQNILPEFPYDGFSEIEVNKISDEYIIPEGTLKIEENGIKNVTNYSEVEVEVQDDLNKELTEQEEELTGLEEEVNALSDKPTDMLQLRVDYGKSCLYLFYSYRGETLDFITRLSTVGVNNMGGMFYSCNKVTEIPLTNLDTSEVTNMGSMFYRCQLVTSLDLSSFDTAKVTSMASMFNDCSVLKKIYGTLDMISVTGTSTMFSACEALENVTLKNIKVSLAMGSGTSYGTLLTNDTLINTFKELWDLTGSTTQTLTLSTTSKNNIANIYVKLVTPTPEEIEADPNIVYKKPCVVCDSTDDGAMTLTEYATSKNWAIA